MNMRNRISGPQADFDGELIERAERISHFFPFRQQLIENLRVGG